MSRIGPFKPNHGLPLGLPLGPPTLMTRWSTQRESGRAGYSDPLSAAQAQTLHDLVDALRTQMKALGATASDPQANPFVPLPKPELRVRSPL